MKTPFIPTAMRCTQEQFEAIKPKLIERWCELEQITDFEEMPYLEAFKVKFTKHVVITNVKEAQEIETKIHEEWNEEIFLRNLGGEEIEEATTSVIPTSQSMIVEYVKYDRGMMAATILGAMISGGHAIDYNEAVSHTDKLINQLNQTL